MSLVVDVGTNAEIMLGNRRRGCSPARVRPGRRSRAPRSVAGSARRPAPSSACASIPRHPRAALPGDRLRISGPTSPGFAQASAESGITGICGSGIIEAIAEMFLAGLVDPTASSTGPSAAQERSRRAEGRTFSYIHEGEIAHRASPRADVRAIQLAKAALYAGVRLLMDHLRVDQRSTGSASPAPSAATSTSSTRWCSAWCRTVALERVTSAGNAAGTGARIALVNKRGARRDRGPW